MLSAALQQAFCSAHCCSICHAGRNPSSNSPTWAHDRSARQQSTTGPCLPHRHLAHPPRHLTPDSEAPWRIHTSVGQPPRAERSPHACRSRTTTRKIPLADTNAQRSRYLRIRTPVLRSTLASQFDRGVCKVQRATGPNSLSCETAMSANDLQTSCIQGIGGPSSIESETLIDLRTRRSPTICGSYPQCDTACGSNCQPATSQMLMKQNMPGPDPCAGPSALCILAAGHPALRAGLLCRGPSVLKDRQSLLPEPT
jgi:hypothetical protein